MILQSFEKCHIGPRPSWRGRSQPVERNFGKQRNCSVIVQAAVGGGRRRGDGGRSKDGSNSGQSGKGHNFRKKNRRRGRPDWLRSPNDTPLRDGNRDRLIGLLTLRATRTLAYYLSETNPVVYHWLIQFLHEHPIPRDGAWDDVSGESFLRTLLSMPTEMASGNWGRSALFSSSRACGVDPRNIAQRIMDIRTRLAKEWTQDLSQIAEENSALMRETLAKSFSLNLDNVTSHPMDSTDTVD